MTDPTVDLEAIKTFQQQMWSAGDFARIGMMTVLVSERLVEAANVMPGERVLDVACGSGNTALAAARRFAKVIGLDYVSGLLEHARERARAELVDAEFVEGDAERLPFEDASFDLVASTFGVMFAPDHESAAHELLRVTKPGGRIALANWTPDGAVGEMFGTVARHAPPPPGVKPPVLWGTDEYLRELFGDAISGMEVERRDFVFRYPSAEFNLEYFRTWFGPTKMAFARLDAAGQEALAGDLLDLSRRRNRGGEAGLAVPATYLEVVATRAG
jgi:ubiquinone/menaquinone biosynthesis C-methylase UbiE